MRRGSFLQTRAIAWPELVAALGRQARRVVGVLVDEDRRDLRVVHDVGNHVAEGVRQAVAAAEVLSRVGEGDVEVLFLDQLLEQPLRELDLDVGLDARAGLGAAGRSRLHRPGVLAGVNHELRHVGAVEHLRLVAADDDQDVRLVVVEGLDQRFVAHVDAGHHVLELLAGLLSHVRRLRDTARDAQAVPEHVHLFLRLRVGTGSV